MLAFTFVNSLGTGVVTNGIFFLTRQAYGFGDAANYTLGIVFAAMYIAGAVAVGPLLTRLAARTDAISHRAILIALMLVLGSACLLPWGVHDPEGGRSAWSIWVLAVIYGPLTGSLWPVVEAYLSGERRGGVLRSATGWFNIVWASAVVLAFWVMAPYVEAHPLAIVAAVGVLHVLSIPVLARFPRDPGRHLDHADHEPHPPVYRDLLRTFRVLLPASYVLSTSIGPFMPGALDRMNVPTAWQTPLTATWLATRVAVFALMGLVHRWHGRWSTAVHGSAALLIGYAIVVLAPRVFEPGPAGVTALILGLAVFGVGMGIVYSAALYYALEVGQAEVSAGGMHEALIGVGYLIGPAIMLGATGAAGAMGRPGAFEWIVLGTIGTLSLGVATVVGRRLVRAGRAAEGAAGQ